jgi:hypothetical protein
VTKCEERRPAKAPLANANTYQRRVPQQRSTADRQNWPDLELDLGHPLPAGGSAMSTGAAERRTRE